MAYWWKIAVFLALLGCNGVRCVLVPGSRLPQMQRKLQTATGLAEMRGEQHRAISATRYTNDWAVQVEGGAQAADTLATATGFINMGQIGNLEGYYHFQFNVSQLSNATFGKSVPRSIGSFSQMMSSPDLTKILQQHQNVGYVQQQRIIERVKKDYIAPTDPDWRRQWSLLNTGSITNGPSGKDLNVEPAWMQGITGSGIIVGVVDNGLEKTHPDLSPNYESSISYDYHYYDNDPTPDEYFGDEPDSHGTMCAGVIGMAKSNARCGVGVAHHARIGGIKFDLGSAGDVVEASVIGHKNNAIHVYSNSWGPGDLGFIVSGPGDLAKRALEIAVTQGRQGKGSIYVWAAGNGGRYHDSCSLDGYSSSIYTISMGSADYDGHQADYDENCPAKMAVTFSYNSQTFPDADSSWDPYNQVSTTTLSGRCTNEFTGTSASTPLMSGTIALVLQANPSLTWRDVQYLVAYTSSRDKLVDGQWVTNGAGLKVSHKFGFGAVDAEAMVTRARRWTNVPQLYSGTANINPSLGRFGTADHLSDISITFDVTPYLANNVSFLEHVVLTTTLNIRNYGTGYGSDDFEEELYFDPDHIYEWLADSHPKRGDIQITLTSPQGTTSTLLPYRLYDFINEEGIDNWPFMSVHYWGENPVGTWEVSVSFRSTSGYVTMSNLQIKLYGTRTTPLSVSRIPAQCDTACRGRCSGTGPQNCDACAEKRVASTQECVSVCPAGTSSFKNYCLDTPMNPATQNGFSSDGKDGNHNSKSSLPIIIGSSVGGVVLLVIIVVSVAVLTCRSRSRSQEIRFTRLRPERDIPAIV